MKKRQGDPWMPAADYGRSLPAFSINLLVRDVDASLPFYRDVLDATVHYSDPDFAALRIGEAEIMLHADHTYDDHPWHERLIAGERRGLGAEIRLFGIDPDAVEARARSYRADVLKEAHNRGHGWREIWVQDPDGYIWAIGAATAQEER
jgi:catechol 2,3-dioxygenase-like lactoylglutathione lyase family enzyme